jgi:hypothetical protein
MPYNEPMQRRFPEGRLGPDDDGETAIAIGVKQGKVIVALPHPMKWIGVTADGARDFASMLLKRAEEIDGKEMIVVPVSK